MTRLLTRFLTGAAILAAPLSLAVRPTPVAAQPPTQPPVTKPAPKDSTQKPAPRDTTMPPGGIPIDGIAAIVGDQVVLISEVEAEAMRRRAQGTPVKSREDRSFSGGIPLNTTTSKLARQLLVNTLIGVTCFTPVSFVTALA